MKKSLLVFCSLFALSIFAPAVAQADDSVKFDLQRLRETANGGIEGNLTSDGNFDCNTLENLDYIHVLTAGRTYNITMAVSGPKLHNQRLPLLEVPGHTGVFIHAGNKPGDSEGCILPGTRDVDGSGALRGLSSGPAVKEIIRLIDIDTAEGIRSTITIR